jgi:hypothetical protein
MRDPFPVWGSQGTSCGAGGTCGYSCWFFAESSFPPLLHKSSGPSSSAWRVFGSCASFSPRPAPISSPTQSHLSRARLGVPLSQGQRLRYPYVPRTRGTGTQWWVKKCTDWNLSSHEELFPKAEHSSYKSQQRCFLLLCRWRCPSAYWSSGPGKGQLGPSPLVAQGLWGGRGRNDPNIVWIKEKKKRAVRRK